VRDPYAPPRAASGDAAMSAPHQAEAPRRHRKTTRGRFPVESDEPADSSNSEEEAPDSAATPAEPPAQAVYVQQEIRQQVNGSTPAGWIELGNPKKRLYVIMDTGSDKLVAKTWDTIKHMLHQVDGGIDTSVSPSANVYDHDTSKTYAKQLVDKKSMMDPTGAGASAAASSSGVKVQKRGYIAYGSGVAITDEGNDDVHVGGQTLPQFPISEILADSLSMLHTKQGIAGILGLQHMKNQTLGESVFTRAREHGGMTSFGYCRGNNNDGTFIWGDKSTEGTEVPVVGNIHWALKMSNIKMVGKSQAESTTTTAPDASAESTGEQTSDQSSEAGAGGAGGSGGEGRGEAPASQEDLEPMRRPRGNHRIASRRNHAIHAHNSQNLAALSSKQEPTGDEETGAADGSSEDTGIDPELKQEIGKMVGDVIDKVVEKIAHAKQGGSRQMSKQMCTDGKCAAIIDTGSNIIAGPSEALREMAKYANVKYDCSNLDKLPHIHLHLGDFKAELPPRAYVMQVTLPKWAAQGKGAAEGGEEGAAGGEDASGGGAGGMDGGAGGDQSMSRRPHFQVKLPGGKTMTTKLDQEASWDAVINELHRAYGVDLSAAMPGMNLAKMEGSDKLCMPAFAPLDKETAVGKLWVIGTPIFEQYYTRWSFPKDADMPSVFFADKNKATACQSSAEAVADPAASEGAASAEEGAMDAMQQRNSRKRRAQSAASAAQVLNSVKSALVNSPGLLRREVRSTGSIQLLDEGSLEAEKIVTKTETKSETGLQGTSFMPRRLDAFDIRYPAWAKDLSVV